jgi:hypothetical protein
MTSQDKVVIFDTTLRDGEQSPGATMTHEEKLEIAGLLDEMGVDIIEAGFPIASEGDFAAVTEISKRARTSTICGLARANFKDIDRCWEAVRHAKSPRIHTFIGTSPLHRAIPNLDMDQMAERIHETVTHARNLCDNVQWSPMDATRTEPDYLCRVVEIAIKAGATTINIPDTVGYTYPMESAKIIRMLLERVPGADRIIFGPGGDLGPVDPQMRYPNGTLASAKELVEAVDEAERRITANPNTYPLFANLLAEVTMIMVEQARSALARSGALVREALSAATGRTSEVVDTLASALQLPLIDEPTSHSAVIGCDAAKSFGLPAESAAPDSVEWALVWALWTRYFAMGAFPVGPVAIYEGDRASQIILPTPGRP